jgi:UPF0755 protein
MISRVERRVRRRRRARGLAIVTAFLVLVGGVLLGAMQLTGGHDGPKVPAGRRVTVTVLPGEGTKQIAEDLERLGVVDSAGRFRRVAEDQGLDGALRPGAYQLTTGMPADRVLEIMARGPQGITLTIPEGFTLNQIVEKLVTVGHFDRADVRAALHDHRLVTPYRPKGVSSLEGLLFPLTYQINKGDTPVSVLQAMLDQLGQVLAGADLSRPRRGVRVTPYQTLVVASLVEREAKVPADRPKVAAVIYNRLRRHIPLQVDPTVQYAWRLRDRVKPRLSLADLRIDSPFNTYLHRGLPPTPICSPGQDAIQAALSPANGEWLYYIAVSANDGLRFTSSYQEFLQLKQKARAAGLA